MCHRELSLDEMLADGIVQITMRRDGVTEQDVRALMAALKRRCLAAELAPFQAIVHEAAHPEPSWRPESDGSSIWSASRPSPP